MRFVPLLFLIRLSSSEFNSNQLHNYNLGRMERLLTRVKCIFRFIEWKALFKGFMLNEGVGKIVNRFYYVYETCLFLE